MNMDRHNDGLKDGGASKTVVGVLQTYPTSTQDRGEIDAMLKRGAHDIFLNDDDSAFQQFAGQDIDEILATSTKIDHNTDTGGGASLEGGVHRRGGRIRSARHGRPRVPPKILREAAQKEEEIPDEFLSRKRKEVKRFGSAKGDEGFDEFEKGEKKGRKYRDGEPGRLAATREHLVEAERMGARAALVRLGRWARVKGWRRWCAPAAARGGGDRPLRASRSVARVLPSHTSAPSARTSPPRAPTREERARRRASLASAGSRPRS